MQHGKAVEALWKAVEASWKATPGVTAARRALRTYARDGHFALPCAMGAAYLGAAFGICTSPY